jgi:hypothetical protein
MAEEEETGSGAKKSAPYTAFQSLKTLTASLKEHGLPQRIDRSLMSNFSGAVQSQLMTALRFLGLITADDRPTTFLQAIVEAHGTDEWPNALQKVLRHAYSEVFRLNLATASPAQFTETFKDAYPAEGDTVRKGITFFLNAAKDAGITISPYIMKNKKPRASNGGSKKRTVQKKKAAPTKPDRVEDDDDDHDRGRIRETKAKTPYEALMNDIYDPTDMSEVEEQAVFTLARYLKKKAAT